MSMSLDSMASMMNTTGKNAAVDYNSQKIKNSLDKVSQNSTEDELMEVCRDFTSYFVEEVIKEVKENMTFEDEDTDSSLSTLTDYHMDSAIEIIADQVIDQAGISFTQQLYEQMKRNYGIE